MVCIMGTSSLGRIVRSGMLPVFLLTCSSLPSMSMKFGTSSCRARFLFSSRLDRKSVEKYDRSQAVDICP